MVQFQESANPNRLTTHALWKVFPGVWQGLFVWHRHLRTSLLSVEPNRNSRKRVSRHVHPANLKIQRERGGYCRRDTWRCCFFFGWNNIRTWQVKGMVGQMHVDNRKLKLQRSRDAYAYEIVACVYACAHTNANNKTCTLFQTGSGVRTKRGGTWCYVRQL